MTDNKSELIKQEQIKKIYAFLSKAYNMANGGYVKTSMSNVAKEAGVSVHMSFTLQATKTLGIMKQQGERRASKWYWPGDMPSRETATKVYHEIRRLKLNKEMTEKTDAKLKERGLVKIIGSKPVVTKGAFPETTSLVDANMKNEKYIAEILIKMFNNQDELLNPVAFAKRYDVDKSFLETLITLDVVTPHRTLPGQFKWTYGRPTPAMAELIMESYAGEIKPEAPTTGKGSRDPEVRRKNVLELLELINSKARGYKKPLTGTIRKLRLHSNYLTLGLRAGIIINEGTTRKPCYKLAEQPSMDTVTKLEELVANSMKKYKGTEQVKSIPATEIKSSNTDPTDVNGIRDRALKRKEYLLEELAKVDKILEAVDIVSSLGAEWENYSNE